MKQQEYYSDLNLAFIPHPLTGDVSTLTDADAVKRAVFHVANLLPFDIPFQPDWHGQVRALLFEPNSGATRAALATNIRWSIEKLEPRAKVLDVEVSDADDGSRYYIEVKFSILSLAQEYTHGFYLQRVR